VKAVVFAYSNVGDRCLRVLCARGVEVALVVTHRDTPGEVLWFHRVADTAAELHIPVLYADDPSEPAVAAAVERIGPDLIFSFYYRAMIPSQLLAKASSGAYNMHGSLLPKYRGRAPTNWAVLHGETETGATLHEMVAKPDAGPIIDQSSVPILPDDTGREVFDKVTVAAEKVLWRSLPAIVAGRATRRPNAIVRGSYFGARRPEDGRIDWSRPAAEIYNLIRAVAPPYPGAFVEIGGKRLVIAAARLLAARGTAARATGRPGLHVVEGRIVGECGDAGRIDVRQLLCGSEVVDACSLAALLDTQHSPETP
jgi:methionyl-tRNA formyltransferase